MLKRLICDESGQAIVEYILIAALMTLTVVIMFRVFGTKITGYFSKVITAGKSEIAGK